MPGIPLRRRLLALAAAGIVPIAAMSAIGFYLLLRQQQVQAERVGLELARALATAVDAELRSSTSVLEALATTADRKSTRLNSSHSQISYAVFCLKKKKIDLTSSSLSYFLFISLHIHHLYPFLMISW